MGVHLIDGEFQSDKYPTTPRGKVPLSVKDPTAQDLLWQYAQRRRSVDAEFSDDLEVALRQAGYTRRAKPPVFISLNCEDSVAGGYVRADQIESVTAERQATPYQTRVRTLSGFSIWTTETIEQVFAKMADALNVEPPP